MMLDTAIPFTPMLGINKKSDNKDNKILVTKKAYMYFGLSSTMKTTLTKLKTMPVINAIVSNDKYPYAAATSISPGFINETIVTP